MALSPEFAFLTDPGLDPEIKKLLLQAQVEEKRAARDAEQKAAEVRRAQDLEQRRFWHNTPLMLALVGTITVFANGLVAYVQGARVAADTVTLRQLEAQLKQSEQRSQADQERRLSELKQQLAQQAADAEAKRVATKDEREFAFRIVERQLSQDKTEAERAQILLFLVRAGVLSGLKESELKTMAEASLNKQGPGIPSLAATPDGLRTVGPEDVREFQAFLESVGVTRIKAEHLLLKTSPGTVPPPQQTNIYPPRQLWGNMVKTAQVLDKLWQKLGGAIEIVAVYRPANAGFFGALPTSTHARFNAVDVRFPGAGGPAEWSAALAEMRDRGEFQGGIGIERGGWIHLDTRGVNATWNTLDPKAANAEP